MTRMTGPDCAVMCNSINTYIHIHTIGIIDQSEWHRMTRMTGPDCVHTVPHRMVGLHAKLIA